MDRWCGRTGPDPCSGSCDAHVLRPSQLQHSVQHVGRDGHLARLSPVRLRTQPIADDTLPARDVGLHESAPACASTTRTTRTRDMAISAAPPGAATRGFEVLCPIIP